MVKQKLFSIIIVNFNYGRFLDEAIQSVLSQSCQDFELIVVDGGSSDDSADIIRKYAEKIVWWCSEPDNGQSDAFNKGFSHATGRFLTWLNADDVFFPGALERAQAAIARHPECEWFAGGCFWLDPELRVIKCSRARPFSSCLAQVGCVPVWAPSSFFTKALLDRVGGVDVRYHYGMDGELWYRFWKIGLARYRPLSAYCWGLRIHPDAKMSGHQFADSEHSAPNHAKWRQIQLEQTLFRERYGVHPPKRITRWLAFSFLAVAASRCDTWRFRGKYFADCFVGREEP